MTSVVKSSTRGATDIPSRFVARAVGAFVVMTLVVGTIVTVAYNRAPGSRPFLQGPRWLDSWFQFDSGWYYTIAADGYSYTPGQQSSVAFFPFYPMLVRGVGSLFGDYQLAGTLLTIAASAGAVALFAGWAYHRLPRASATTAVLLLLVYPYSFFLYGSMYADAVFLLTALAAFVLLERGQFWLAGLVGALATAGRPVGIAVVVGLAVRAVEMRAQRAQQQQAEGASEPDGIPGWLAAEGRARVSARELGAAVRLLRWRESGVLLSGAGLAGWCVYLWVTFGNPLAFLAAQSAPGWDQGSGPRTWFKIPFFAHLMRGDARLTITLTAQALACLLAVLLLRRVWRRFGWGYLAYAVVALAVPLIGTKDFMGTGRYLLAAFPVIAAAGDLLAGSRHAPWLRPLAIGGCVVGLVVAATFYARGVPVS